MNYFRPSPLSRTRPRERGVTILLISVAMLFMVLAIAAIAIDVGAMYTARGEAKHAADAAALAGAKVLANSGMTSETGPTKAALQVNARNLAVQVAISVATRNEVGERNLVASEVNVSFNSGASFDVAPQVTVTVQRTDLPTFFAKAWGRSTVTVGATSVAEAVNPSSSNSVTASGNPIPIAPSCVKPWLVANLDPTSGGTPFFSVSGAIMSSGMVGRSLTITPLCNPGTNGACAPTLPGAAIGGYYPAAFTTPPSNQEPTGPGCSLNCDYEENIAACSPQPIACGVSPNAIVDMSGTCNPSYHASTNTATSCLIHNPPGPPGQDTITVGGGPPAPPLSQPMQFIAGANNPLVGAGQTTNGSQVSASDSLVTVPVFSTVNVNSGNANVIGFIQGFITGVGPAFGVGAGSVTMRIVNLSGCGNPSGTPVIGDGISPVPVHLISP